MGSGTQKRAHALAVRVSILAETMTHRAIAGMVGKRPEQIKGLIELGLRLRSVDSSCDDIVEGP